MSTILKALDRLEREKGEAGERPPEEQGNGRQGPERAPSHGSRRLVVVGVAVVGVVGGMGLGAVLFAPWLATEEPPVEAREVSQPTSLAPQSDPEIALARAPAGPGPGSGTPAPADPAPGQGEPIEAGAPAPHAAAAAPPPPAVPEGAADSAQPLPATAGAEPRELPAAALASEVSVVDPRPGRVPAAPTVPDDAPLAVILPQREAPRAEPDPPLAPPARAAPARSSAPAPEFSVAQTVWHPLRERRLALVEVQGERAPRRLREGERLGPLLVVRIDPSSVTFDHDGTELRRRVGGGR